MEKEQKDLVVEDKKEDETLQDIPKEYSDLFEVGAHFGHQKARVHPSMFPFIFGIRNGVHIIDIEKTVEKLNEAVIFLTKQASMGKNVLFVGTKVPVKDLVRDAAEKSGMYYMIERWPGGVLTNWKTFSKTLERLHELEEMKKSEEWGKYTKYERLVMDRELGKLNTQWGGIKELKKVPDALFVTDINHDEIAVAEAKKLGIPIVAIVDTNVDVRGITYIIPANDDSISTASYVLDKAVEAINKGKLEKGKLEKGKLEEKKS